MFKQALAFDYGGKTDDALKCLIEARELIQLCITTLSNDASHEKDVDEGAETLHELNNLLPDIDEKISELAPSTRAPASTDASVSPLAPKSDINDLSGHIKKRKSDVPDEDSSLSQGKDKKAKED